MSSANKINVLNDHNWCAAHEKGLMQFVDNTIKIEFVVFYKPEMDPWHKSIMIGKKYTV